MPRDDLYHDVVVTALSADGWVITDVPLRLEYGEAKLYVDLGAEHTLGAEKRGRQIAVEIKSFIGQSDLNDLEDALGQYNLYRAILHAIKSKRELYLAVPERAYREIFEYPIGLLVLEHEQMRLVVFDENTARIVKWIP